VKRKLALQIDVNSSMMLITGNAVHVQFHFIRPQYYASMYTFFDPILLKSQNKH